jgi:hypothetical protein
MYVSADPVDCQRKNRMRIVAIVLFCIAGLLTALLMPNNMALIQLTGVSIARALALILALGFWVACGRLDSWGSNRIVVGLGAILGALALTGGCLFIQITRDDNVPAPWPWVYCITAALLPICFMAAALLPSRKMFIIASVLAPIAGLTVISTWKQLNATYIENLPETKQRRENEVLLASRLAEVDRIPANAGPESFLEFINPDELWDVRTKAQERIEAIPDWIARLSPLLNGEKRLNALYVLTRKAGSLPDDVLERCWSVAESIARERTELVKKGTLSAKADEQMLYDSVYQIGDPSETTREKHCKELVAVQEYLLAVKTTIDAAFLDGWVRKAQLNLIREDAGIVPLLEFVGPEAYDVREEALARIARIPDSASKLAELLDGPARLGALVALAKTAGELQADLLERCWRAAGLTAREMAAGIKLGNPPAQIEVRKLSSSAGLLWAKLGSNHPEGRLADLAVMRDVVQAVGADWEKAEFAWADRVLAAGNASGSEKGKK